MLSARDPHGHGYIVSLSELLLLVDDRSLPPATGSCQPR